jgi:hypothetical protein
MIYFQMQHRNGGLEVSHMAAGIPIQVRFQHDELGVLDDYRRKQPNPPSRGKALRDLARAALHGAMAARYDDRPTSPK